MTTFHRSGYYRTSKHGVRHWVSGTTVHRDIWSRGYYGYTPPPAQPTSPKDPFLERHPEFTKERRVTACFVNPNATCPVCGERVYYYQNENGSRVFFDELVPPWPKHPCTDTRLFSAPLVGIQSGMTFETRTQSEVAEIMTWQKDHATDFEAEFTTKYGTRPWQLATIVKRLKGEKQVFIIAKLLKQEHARNVYLSCKSLPKCCKKGLLIAVGTREISFVDPATLAPVEVSTKRYRGAARFLDAMDGAETDER